MDKNRPVYEKRIGNIRVAIWENVSDGKTADAPKNIWHNVTIVRRYKDNGGGWKEISSYNGLGDLSQVGTAVWLAQEWLRKRQDELQTQDDGAE